jgi:hypothetical protein
VTCLGTHLKLTILILLAAGAFTLPILPRAAKKPVPADLTLTDPGAAKFI